MKKSHQILTDNVYVIHIHSGSLADSSSNGNDNNKMTGSTESNSPDGFIEHDVDNARSSSSSGSTDIYKVHRQCTTAASDSHNKSNIRSNEKESHIQSVGTKPSIELSGTTASQSLLGEAVEDDNNGEECYSPQQNAPPLISDSMAKSNYHRLPFTDKL